MYEKVEILEKSEYCEIYDYRKYQHRALTAAVGGKFLHQISCDIVNDYRADHQKNVQRLAPAVKYEADCEQYDISRTDALSPRAEREEATICVVAHFK